MAECNFCDREMLDVIACNVAYLAIHVGEDPALDLRRRVRYGKEALVDIATSRRCADCNCVEGGVHHHGCDVEQCPWCSGQLLSCDHAGAIPTRTTVLR